MKGKREVKEGHEAYEEQDGVALTTCCAFAERASVKKIILRDIESTREQKKERESKML